MSKIAGQTMSVVCYSLLSILLVAKIVSCDDASPIPAAPTQVNAWFTANVKPFEQRKATLDPALVRAESSRRVIKVRANGGRDFKTLTDAIKSIPSGNTKRVIIDLGSGVFREKVIIGHDKPFITLRGSPQKPAKLTFHGTAKQYGTVYSATLQVDSNYFVSSHIIYENTAPRPKPNQKDAQALAMRIGGDKAAFYYCKFLGFQDTLCDDRGRHFFKDCYVEGTVDFIFGSGKSLYLKTRINVIADPGVITAQARHTAKENSGYSFVHCSVGGAAKKAFLGRAWMEMPAVVFAYSNMSSAVNPLGWSNNFHPEREKGTFFGEYKNSGAGANLSGRVKFSKKLNDADAKSFLTLGHIGGSRWLLPPR